MLRANRVVSRGPAVRVPDRYQYLKGFPGNWKPFFMPAIWRLSAKFRLSTHVVCKSDCSTPPKAVC
jgi:hypothetical protein